MDIEILKKELTYRTSRSGGSGGQNVNKVETKVETLLDVLASEAFTDAEKELIFSRLENQITKAGIISAVNQTERSQLANKLLAEKKLIRQIEKALIPEPKRLPTGTRRSVLEAREQMRRRDSEKKQMRRKVKTDDGFDLFF
jgi:ribosome-associated protein